MKKNRCCNDIKSLIFLYLRRMKLTLGLIILTFFSSMAADLYSQTTKINLDCEDIKIMDVLTEIENQSEFRFFYNEEINLSSRVSVNVSDKQVSDVLDILFNDKPVNYEILGRQVVLSAQNEQTEVFQQNSISGLVTDASGQPLPGVTVFLKGTSNGTTTSTEGRYSINNVPENGFLVFTFIGMKTQEIPIDGKKIINIILSEVSIDIEEIVTIGYGTVKKRDLTGSVASISAKDIGVITVTNSAQILQGKASGVMVTSVSGSPGADMNIRIRGLGTVNSNEPLYVIDGIPTSGMNNLNPNDIESIEVLKDASSSAIYGSRAASGVVLITTKKGAVGTPKITFESYMGVSTPSKSPTQLNSEQYHDMIQTAHLNGGTKLPKKLESEYEKGYDTNWWDEFTQKGVVQNYFLSASGGSEKVKYAFSGGFFKQEGTIKASAYERISFRLNSDYSITEKLKVGLNLGITNSTRNSITEGTQSWFGLVSEALNMDPMVPVINPDADVNDPDYEFNKYGYTSITDSKNPVATTARTFNESNNFKTLGNAYLNYTILDGLSYRMNVGIDINNALTDNFNPRFYLTPSEKNSLASIYRSYGYSQGIVLDNMITYTKTIEDHNFTAIAVFTSEEQIYDRFGGSKQETLTNDEANRVLDAATTSDQISGTKSSNSLLSYLGRINYSFKDKYLLTASIRRDGSSRFAPGYNWGLFPSVSLGWKINEESFFKKLNVQFVDLLKLRTGWGQIGNQNISDYAYLSLIKGSNSTRYVIGGVPLQGYAPIVMGNPNIKWETVESSNFGIDANLFKNKVSFSADYYIKETRDMLLQVPLVKYSGYPSDPWSNAGSIRNIGWDIQLNYRNLISDFKYDLGVNLTTLNNEVISLGTGGAIYGGKTKLGQVTKTEVGQPIGSFYGYVMDGIFQNNEEVEKGVQPNAEPGDIRFKDIAGTPDSNGNPTGPDGIIDGYDLTYIGNPIPDFLLGFSMNLTYKNFDLGLFLQGVYGNEIYNASKFFTFRANGRYNMDQDAYLNAWNGEGTSNTIPRIVSTEKNNNFRNSSFFIEDGSYLRLKDIHLGYSLPSSLCKVINISNLRLFVSAQNLVTFTKYSGLDPEIGSSTLLDVGIDYGTYPQPKTLMGGISINF